jgi:D-proline reductase (dithiol) PrdB
MFLYKIHNIHFSSLKNNLSKEDLMEDVKKIVDGFRFLPPSLKAWVRASIPEEEFKGYIPWKSLAKPISQSTISLVTSSGISLKSDPPFDMEREKREPHWGDRSFRKIPRGTTSKDIDVNHLHINTSWIKKDINVMLPLERMIEFEEEGIIGRLAPTSYSFYGFQWNSTEFLSEAIKPISESMKLEEVEAVLLTPA